MRLEALYLKRNEERRLLAGHLWIYSNEIDTVKSPLKNFQPGDLVEVISAQGKKLGISYLNPKTLLAARFLTKKHNAIDLDFFLERIGNALKFRELCFSKPYYRLVFGESDYLPGLVVDRFNDILVVQITTWGMERLQDKIIAALVKLLNPTTILLRNDTPIRELEGLKLYTATAHGASKNIASLIENDVKFKAPILEGQKTGWFYDQRQNRLASSKYVSGKRVLDLYSYIGSFGIEAAVFGASEVCCIDSSAKAIALAKENAELNGVSTKVHCLENDAEKAMSQFKQNREYFDVIALDPPALIKKSKDIVAGSKFYQRLQELALQLLTKSGILVTTSCSMHLNRDAFLSIIRKASLSVDRKVSILEELHQAQDHPIHLAIPETNYLKGFIIRDRS